MKSYKNKSPVEKLIIDLNSARARLKQVRENAAVLERTSPTAFAEIRMAKNIVSSAAGVVELYTKQLEEQGINLV